MKFVTFGGFLFTGGTVLLLASAIANINFLFYFGSLCIIIGIVLGLIGLAEKDNK